MDYTPMGAIFEHGPADTIPLPADEPRRKVAAKVAVVAAKDARRVAAATRDGLIFEVVSHSVAAVAGVGLFPLIEHAVHTLLHWVTA